MDDAIVSAEAVADFEKRLNVKLPPEYVGIPKPVFACLSIRYVVVNRRREDAEMISLMASVLLKLTAKEAYEIAGGQRLSANRSKEIARQLSLTLEAIEIAMERYRFFWNEGTRLPRGKKNTKKRRK
ncbi:MAG: hypothetical protein AAF483_11570 [Planctomycetota bacterium]